MGERLDPQWVKKKLESIDAKLDKLLSKNEPKPYSQKSYKSREPKERPLYREVAFQDPVTGQWHLKQTPIEDKS